MMAGEKMTLSVIDPLHHPEWDRLVLGSPGHSFFHSSAWARTLVASYGYQPVYLALPGEERFALLMPLMEVDSRLTGRRGVSLPFTDQSPVLASGAELFGEGVQAAVRHGGERGWRYIEWRDAGHHDDSLPASDLFYVHDVDLNRTAERLFSSLSDNNRRNIKKSQREGVAVAVGTSFGSIEAFGRLNLITRKRHGLPPQPSAFFRNVYEHILAKDHGVVVSASHQGRVVAASVFFHFGKKAIYKYGASDLAYQHLRPNNLVMWEALAWYNARGFETLSLGRTEMDNPGLLQFKRTWGGVERLAKYHRYDLQKKEFVPLRAPASARFERLFSRMPTGALRLVGRFFYKHAG
jgi:CelD/BcsL family acetyltransferase involved in cellulose biosynthesis